MEVALTILEGKLFHFLIFLLAKCLFLTLVLVCIVWVAPGMCSCREIIIIINVKGKKAEPVIPYRYKN